VREERIRALNYELFFAGDRIEGCPFFLNALDDVIHPQLLKHQD